KCLFGLAITDIAISYNKLFSPVLRQHIIHLENAENGKSVEEAITVIEAPRQSDLMVELIKTLKPEVVVTGMAQYESVTSSSFEHLLDVTREIGCRLLLDISDHFELSSLPSSNGVFKYLAGNTLPSHASIVCGLLKNQVYADLEVAFVISEDEAMFKALCKTVELLQGSTSIISQYYYGCLFNELLAFQLSDRHPPAQRNTTRASKTNGFSTSTMSVLDHAELAVNEPDESALVHMDVDQIFLPITTPEGGTLCFPNGTNGSYVSAAKFVNAKSANIQTNVEEGYKLTEKTLTTALKGVEKPWVYISGPTINPTGLIYSNEEINKLLSVCAKFGARVILDTSFSGVEFNSKGFGGWKLGATLEKLYSESSAFCISLLGGLFFKLLTGGISFGFLLIDQPALVETFHSFAGLSKPHVTTKYMVKKLLDLREEKRRDLLKAISEQTDILGSRYRQLKQTLETSGWDVLEAQAGISILAKPSAYLGKTIKIKKGTNTQEIKLDDSNIREAMLRSTGLCINSASWTGIPGYCRLTIALEEGDFKQWSCCESCSCFVLLQTGFLLIVLPMKKMLLGYVICRNLDIVRAALDLLEIRFALGYAISAAVPFH
ncbi:methionine S-methyltransferase, partial [Striga asiatica]